MHDRDDDNAFPVATHAVEDLKTITYLLKGLYGRLKQEQEAISLASGQMSFSAEQFKEHMERIETFEKNYLKYIDDTIKNDLRQSVKAVTREIGLGVAEHAHTPIYQSLSNLTHLSARAEQAFDQQVRQVNRIKLVFAALLLLASLSSGILGGLVVHYYLPETNNVSRNQMIWGGILMKAFPHLSKAEKDKITQWGTGH